MEEQNFCIKIKGIIFNPSVKKILIGKRKGDEFYSFVDGELKDDEELNSSLKRIIQERTGYIVSNLGAVFAERSQKRDDRLNIYFLCEIKGGKEKLAEYVKEIKWIKANEIEKLINETLPKRLKEYVESIAS